MKSRKVRSKAQSTKMADGIYPKLYIFNTPVQKEGNLPGFHIHTVFWGLMKTPMLSSAGFVCLRVGYREVFWEEFSRLT